MANNNKKITIKQLANLVRQAYYEGRGDVVRETQPPQEVQSDERCWLDSAPHEILVEILAEAAWATNKNKRHKPIQTPVMRGEANYYLSKLFLFGDAPKRIGQQLWRHGFKAGVKAARKQIKETY